MAEPEKSSRGGSAPKKYSGGGWAPKKALITYDFLISMRVSKLSRGAQTFLEGAQPPPATPWLRHCIKLLEEKCNFFRQNAQRTLCFSKQSVKQSAFRKQQMFCTFCFCLVHLPLQTLELNCSKSSALIQRTVQKDQFVRSERDYLQNSSWV